MSNFYKIECKDTLSKIDEFMAKRDALYEQVRLICEKYGFDHHITHESIQNGVIFHNMTANPDKDIIDKKIWKTSKHRSGYLNVLPRATAKKHKAEYEALKPKRLYYTELNKIILGCDVSPWSKSYGYRWKKGEYFMFETSLPVSEIAIEILGSEYNKKCDHDED